MNSPLPASAPAQRRSWTRRLVNLLVALVVIAVAAAAFVFSYDGVHAIALLGGMSVQLARYYPGLFDAVLVIACVAAVMLRDGRWWARLWAWVVIIVVLAAIGTTDVLHAMNFTLPHRPTEGIVAAAPIVAVLLAFSLLLTMLRQSRTHGAAPAGPAPLDVPALPAAVSAPPIALPAAPVADCAAPAEAAPQPRPRLTRGCRQRARMPMPRRCPARAGCGARRHQPNEAIAGGGQRPGPAARTPTDGASPVHRRHAAARQPARPVQPTVPAGRQGRRPGPHGIRYAGNGVPGMARKVQAAEDDAAPSADYWDAEEAGQFAGLVYPLARATRTSVTPPAAMPMTS